MWSNHGDILQPTFYRVIIDLSNGTDFPTSGTTGGGITPNPGSVLSGTNYYYNDSGSKNYTAPTTDAAGLLRERGNIRWEKVVEQLNKYTQADIMNINITEATGNAQGTSLSFTVRYERDSFNVEDSIASPGTPLSGKDCVAQLIATAISNTYTRIRSNVWQPESHPDTPGQQMSVTATTPCSFSTAAASITVENTSTSGSGIEETAQYVL